ncbi:MAG: FumA C-terminus/TtdB family hydratase beta subunit [Desulfobacterales bacterium]|nr:FumA C-terminus/TtdB family hydratase beta subunit [Desulfobacterales bacterium]
MNVAAIDAEKLYTLAYGLLANAANKYPQNYLDRLFEALESDEHPGARSVFVSIIENILSAAEDDASLCQDTGVPVFHVYLNPAVRIDADIEQTLAEATAKATVEVPIRRNVIEPFTYENPGTNTGWGTPFIHYHYSPNPEPFRMRVELKGFGGEIKSTGDWVFTSAEKMQDAVLAYVLNNVILSRGEGCIPGFLGVGVGGYMCEAMSNAKNAVYRELSAPLPESLRPTPDAFATEMEDRILRCVNRLGLGPMGGGGVTTTMGVFLERRGTHTAVASVAVSQQCWASRGSEALVDGEKTIYLTPHLEKASVPAIRSRTEKCFTAAGKGAAVRELTTPIAQEELLKLRVGDVVYVNGTICTSRDGAHRRMVEKVRSGRQSEIPSEILENGIIFHCGPVILQTDAGWEIVSAGPTTSSRFTTDASVLTQNGIIKAAIGKGTMGDAMIQALTGRGVYLTAVGGCAVSYRKMIRGVDVKWLDLGYPEAVWVLQVERFGPLVVGIDSTGQSASRSVMQSVYENARQIYADEGMDPGKRYIQYPQTIAGFSLEEVIAKSQSA